VIPEDSNLQYFVVIKPTVTFLYEQTVWQLQHDKYITALIYREKNG